MKSNISDHQFLEGDDIIVVQSDTPSDYEKASTKNVKVKSLREDIRNYVDSTTTKELKVFRSSNTAAGGRIDVLDNETLYYYPATPVSSLEDKDIVLTSIGDYFRGIDNQQEFNEKASDHITNIELSLEDTDKYLEALKASTTFLPDNTDPTSVDFFVTSNQYPNTPVDPATGAVVNINDLNQVNGELQNADQLLQNQISLNERRVEALFNVKVDSGYFCHQSLDPENDLPDIGQIKVDLTNLTDDVVVAVHGAAYPANYTEDEDPDNAEVINNYLVANVTDSIVTSFNTFELTSVEVVDADEPLDNRVYILKGTTKQAIADQVADTDFTTLRIVGDGEFDPASLNDVFVKRAGGDSMEGPLEMKARPNTDSRVTNKITTLGVYSSSDSSALRFGTAGTKMYVGASDTAFSTMIKVPKIAEWNSGDGISIANELVFEQQGDLITIAPDNGTTQNINLFSGANADLTTVKVNLNGATFRNSIEFESGPSQNKEIILRIDSNKGIRIRNLNMDSTKIKSLMDPTDDQDAATKKYVDDQDAATKQYVDDQDAATKQYVDDLLSADGSTNWDLIANNDNHGFDFYYTDTSDGFRTLNISGGVINTTTAYGIWMSENMLNTLLNEDFNGEVNITDWVSYWTGGGTITFRTEQGNTPIVRTLTEVEQVTMSGYPGVKFMFSETADLRYYMQWVTTQDAFIQTPGSVSEVIMPLVFPNMTGSYYANDDQIQSINRSGDVDSVTYGFNIPWKWFEKNYPDIIGWVQDGLGAFIGDRNATVSLDTNSNRPGLKILSNYQVSGRPNVTIPGFAVYVDKVEEPQWGHKFP